MSLDENDSISTPLFTGIYNGVGSLGLSAGVIAFFQGNYVIAMGVFFIALVCFGIAQVVLLLAKIECNTRDKERSAAQEAQKRLLALAAISKEETRRIEQEERRIEQEERHVQMLRKEGEEKILHYGDLCERCTHFTPTLLLPEMDATQDAKSGFCARFQMCTKKNHSCGAFVPI